MIAAWNGNLESLEAVSQDRLACRLVTQMAELERSGRLAPFLIELNEDPDLDDRTKRLVGEIAADSTFLQAVDDYVRRTAVQH